MKKLIFVIAVILVLTGLFFWNSRKKEEPVINIADFKECLAQGYQVLESYPRQCRTPDGQTFIEDIGNELEEKVDLIQIMAPRPNQLVSSPLEIEGQARGYWFFEGDFPIRILDGDGTELGVGIAKALSAWMTEDFVPFEAVLEFDLPTLDSGNLILEKDNPSGLPEHDDQLRVPLRFSE